MFVRILSFALEGINAVPVSVEVDVSRGIPAFEVVGLPDAAVREARERVRAAIRNGGWKFPPQRITVNLAPAHTRKGGAGFDLAIALGVLAAGECINPDALHGVVAVGELALDGTLRPVRGALAIALAARSEGCHTLLMPTASAREAAWVGGEIYAASSLTAVVAHLTGVALLPRVSLPTAHEPEESGLTDLVEVKGQAIARRAVEIAAAGAHCLLLVGPPGAGKSLLARTLPGILPPLTPEESLEVSRIYSAIGSLPGERLMTRRPYRAPHHSASRAALLGGGNPLRPGEITLAHHGVLFLDELPEFGRDALEGLRQPLEEGRIMICRTKVSAEFPARPMLVAAANPCPCGYSGDPTADCTCPPAAVALYRARLSGPLLDRFDMHVFVPRVPYDEYTSTVGEGATESSCTVRQRVEKARLHQRTRFGTQGGYNAHMTPQQVRRSCALCSQGTALMKQAVERMGLSLRGHDKVLKVARTVADLASSERIEMAHLAEALQYRGVDRRS